MPGNENTKSGILQGLFICRTSELNPRNIKYYAAVTSNVSIFVMDYELCLILS